jgi:hypothetical protein
MAYPETVRIADPLNAVAAPVALAAALYRVPVFADVSPVRLRVDAVAFATFDQVEPASSDDCHW